MLRCARMSMKIYDNRYNDFMKKENDLCFL